MLDKTISDDEWEKLCEEPALNVANVTALPAERRTGAVAS